MSATVAQQAAKRIPGQQSVQINGFAYDLFYRHPELQGQDQKVSLNLITHNPLFYIYKSIHFDLSCDALNDVLFVTINYFLFSQRSWPCSALNWFELPLRQLWRFKVTPHETFLGLSCRVCPKPWVLGLNCEMRIERASFREKKRKKQKILI